MKGDQEDHERIMSAIKSPIQHSQTAICLEKTLQQKSRILEGSQAMGLGPSSYAGEGVTQKFPQWSKNHRSGCMCFVDAIKDG